MWLLLVVGGRLVLAPGLAEPAHHILPSQIAPALGHPQKHPSQLLLGLELKLVSAREIERPRLEVCRKL